MVEKNLPLKGVRVLDFSNILAGPVVALYLGWMGAEVIRIETPIGDPGRYHRERTGNPPDQLPVMGVMYTVFNRGKRGMVLDMAKPEGLQIAHDLIKKWQPDIVVVAFKPSDLKKLKMDFDTLKGFKKDIIMVSATAFGLSGADFDKPGYENISQSLSGIQYVQGDPSAPPSKIYPHVGDMVTSAFGISGALLALIHRNKTGEGQLVDMSITDCLVSISEYLMTNTVLKGKPPERTGNIDFSVGPYTSFPTKDDRWITLGAVTEAVYLRLLKAIEDVPGGKEIREKWGTHPMGRYMLENIYEYNKEFSEMTRQLDAADLVARFEKQSVPVGLVRNYQEVIDNEHFQSRGVIRWVDHGNGTKLPHPGSAITSSAYDLNTDAPSPCLGEHTNEVLKEILGFDDKKLQELYDTGVTKPRPIMPKAK